MCICSKRGHVINYNAIVYLVYAKQGDVLRWKGGKERDKDDNGLEKKKNVQNHEGYVFIFLIYCSSRDVYLLSVLYCMNVIGFIYLVVAVLGRNCYL